MPPEARLHTIVLGILDSAIVLGILDSDLGMGDNLVANRAEVFRKMAEILEEEAGQLREVEAHIQGSTGQEVDSLELVARKRVEEVQLEPVRIRSRVEAVVDNSLLQR